MFMEKSLSIVPVPATDNYRLLAQQHWGLTDEQMKGMEVHHWVPQSEGGTHDPSNLYVLSNSLHRLIHLQMGRAYGFMTPLTEEQEKARQERTRKTRANWSEEKREKVGKGISEGLKSKSPEEKARLAERKRKTRAQKSKETREEWERQKKKTWAKRTKEQNMESSRKRQETRRRNNTPSHQSLVKDAWKNRTEEQRAESKRKRRETRKRNLMKGRQGHENPEISGDAAGP